MGNALLFNHVLLVHLWNVFDRWLTQLLKSETQTFLIGAAPCYFARLFIHALMKRYSWQR